MDFLSLGVVCDGFAFIVLQCFSLQFSAQAFLEELRTVLDGLSCCRDDHVFAARHTDVFFGLSSSVAIFRSSASLTRRLDEMQFFYLSSLPSVEISEDFRLAEAFSPPFSPRLM